MSVKNKIFVFVILFLSGLAIGLIVSQKVSKTDEEITTDLVNNPISADNKDAKIDKNELPEMKFDKESIDFGDIMQGEKISHTFLFKNTGKSRLIISDVRGSCGCTVAKWTEKPVEPGEKGEIEVTFDSKGKHGKQNKTVTILCNTQPNTKILNILANIIES